MFHTKLLRRTWAIMFALSIVFGKFAVTQAQIRNKQQHFQENHPDSHLEILDPEKKYRLEWDVDRVESRITFSVTVQTTGYIGFGLSRKGDLENADIVLGGVNKDGSSYFSDRHGISNGEPAADPSQDWQLLTSWENYTHTHLSFTRDYDTCDHLHDYRIDEHDHVHLIWAYGEGDNPEDFQYGKRGDYQIYLLDPEFVPRSIKEASFDQGSSLRPSSPSGKNLRVWTVSTQLSVPPEDTTYICTMHQAPRLRRKHHIVGLELRLETEEAVRHIHHIVFYKCTAPENTDPVQFFGRHLHNGGEQCYFLGQPTGQIPTQYCTEVVYVFAVGGRIWFTPEDTGLAFGESPNEFYTAQFHYDNPSRLRNVNVEAHLDVYYTRDLRENELGLITMGHHIPGSPSILIPPSSNVHRIFGYCGADCTRQILPPEGITLVATILHTHNSGTGLRIRHFRDGQELAWIKKDDNYSNLFQPFRALNPQVQIKRGDHITIDCTFDNTWANGTVVGGFSTSQEMCLVYFYYHNKMPDYRLCRSEITSAEYRRDYLGIANNNLTWSNEHLEFVATSPSHLAGLTMTQISDDHVKWTPRLRAKLQQDQLTLSQRNVCSRAPFSSSGQGQVQGITEDPTYDVTHPTATQEYSPSGSRCGRGRRRGRGEATSRIAENNPTPKRARLQSGSGGGQNGWGWGSGR